MRGNTRVWLCLSSCGNVCYATLENTHVNSFNSHNNPMNYCRSPLNMRDPWRSSGWDFTFQSRIRELRSHMSPSQKTKIQNGSNTVTNSIQTFKKWEDIEALRDFTIRFGPPAARPESMCSIHDLSERRGQIQGSEALEPMDPAGRPDMGGEGKGASNRVWGFWGNIGLGGV